MREITEVAIQEIVDAIIQHFDPAAIYLFGSRARNEAQDHSDIDLLVVSHTPFTPERSRQHELARLWHLIARYRLPVDVILYSQDEIEEWRSTPGHIIARALCEGRKLYTAA